MWEAITALIITLGGIVAAVVRYALRQEKPKRAIREQASVYDTLNTLRHDALASRVVIVKTHNGGGLPSAKTPLFSSALYEVTGDEARPLKRQWARLPIDEEYMRALSRLLEDGEVEIDTRTMESGTLRDIYASAAVHSVRKVYLTHDSKALYYLSLHWSGVEHQPGAQARLAIRSAVAQLRHLLASA
jgi:hypothetical protein